MKLLHTSDWHLGMGYRGGITYQTDQRFAINGICKIAEEEKADGIIIAGDIFDRSIASHEALQAYDDIMTYICSTLGIPVYLIAGNHDGADRISQCSELLKKSGLYISGALEKDPYVVRGEDTDIFLLPWISTDKVISIYPDEKDNIKSMEDAYRVVLDHYRESFETGKKNILAAHAYIIDAETSESDKAAVVGTATMVGASVFDGFDYVALGHLHGPQKINEHIRYSGTPMAYSFGKEEKQEKSVVIIDTDKMEIKTVPVPQLRKRITLSGKYKELLEGEYSRDILDAYVRLEISDAFVTLETISIFREKFANLLEVSGKSLEKEDAKITMTIDELEKVVTDPVEVFVRYCQDSMGESPSEHSIELFKKAVDRYEKEEMEK